MSLASIATGAIAAVRGVVSKKKHPAIEQFEQDVAFFRALRRSIEVERDPVRKEELLGNAVAALKDGKYNVIAKMSLASLIDGKSDWDAIVAQRAEVMARSLAGDEIARSHGADVMSRAQSELPILIINLANWAAKGKRVGEGQAVWSQYQKERPKLDETLGLWKALNAEKNEGKKQAIRAGIWTRAMDETLSAVVRLEMLEPRSALVSQWKVLAQKLAKGEDVARDLAGLKLPLERALTSKLASFAKETFGVAV